MTAKTYYFAWSTFVTTYNFLVAQDGGTPPGSGKFHWYKPPVTAKFARLATRHNVDAGGSNPVSTTSAEPDVETGPANAWYSTSADCCRTSSTILGGFAAGTWSFKLLLAQFDVAASRNVRVRIRVWRSANANGTSAVELTSSVLVGSTAALVNSSLLKSEISWNAPGISLTNEYLFFQFGFEVVSGSGTPSDFSELYGTYDFGSGNEYASVITPEYIPGVVVIAPSFSATGHVGTVDITGANLVDVNVTGVQGTAQLGIITLNDEFDAVGLSATAALGSIAEYRSEYKFISSPDYSGSPDDERMRALVLQLGTIAVFLDANVSLTGFEASALLNDPALVIGVVIDVSGVSATGAVGVTGYGIGVELVPHGQPLAPLLLKHNLVSVQVDHANHPVGLYGSGALGTPSVRLDPTAPGLSVSGSSQLGTVTIQIDKSVSAVGLQASCALGVPSVQPNKLVAAVGLQGVSALGDVVVLPEQRVHPALMPLLSALGLVHTQFGYGVIGVHGDGQVGTLGFSIGHPSPSVSGVGHVGTPSFIIDSSVAVQSLSCAAVLGDTLADSSTPLPQGVVAYGQVGVVGFRITSHPIKRIYTTVTPAL
jgi:hypothetical protein